MDKLNVIIINLLMRFLKIFKNVFYCIPILRGTKQTGFTQLTGGARRTFDNICML